MASGCVDGCESSRVHLLLRLADSRQRAFCCPTQRGRAHYEQVFCHVCLELRGQSHMNHCVAHSPHGTLFASRSRDGCGRVHVAPATPHSPRPLFFQRDRKESCMYVCVVSWTEQSSSHLFCSL